MVADSGSPPLSFFPLQDRLLVIWGGLFSLLLPGHLFFFDGFAKMPISALRFSGFGRT
jgi:hypothetical protein